jgi:hypothetical protein
VTYTDRMPSARMPPSVTGWLGRSLAGGSGDFLPMPVKRRSFGEGSDGAAGADPSKSKPRAWDTSQEASWRPRRLGGAATGRHGLRGFRFQDRPAAGLILAGKVRDGLAGFQGCPHRGALIFAQGGATAGLLAFRPCPLQPRLSALNQKIALELGDGGQDVHRHAPGRAGHVGASELKAMHLDADRGELVDGRDHVNHVPSQAIQLADDEDVAAFETIEQALEALSLTGSA